MDRKKLIFAVDDDPLILTIVKRELEKEDREVRTFQYGEQCLNALGDNPDLIVLDYFFQNKEKSKVLDGKEIFSKIQEHDNPPPVIMLSGQEDGDVVLELARMGINDYVIKDQSLSENLREVVDEIFEKDK